MDRIFKTFCIAGMAFLAACCPAQAPPNDSATLRVYVNRIQIPVLVLSQYGRPLRPIPESSFRLSIAGLGTFQPSHVRLEGDDPLAVAVIVDASDPGETMWRELPMAVDRMLPTLNTDDRLTLYGLDGCKAFRFVPEDAPLNATLVHAGVEHAMNMTAKTPVKGRPAEACAAPLTMPDMISYVVARLSSFPGRRMVVTVGAGAGYGGRMDALKQMLNAESVMLLPLVHNSAYAAMPMPLLRPGGGTVAVVNGGFGSVFGNLAELAEYSGGRVRYLAGHEFASSLAEAVATARGRYILEFPRPDRLAAGHYRITVTDGHPRDFIRASGISVPVANAEEIAAARATAQGADAARPGAQATAAPAVPAAVSAPASAVAVPQMAAPAITAPAPRVAQPDPTDITVDLQPSR